MPKSFEKFEYERKFVISEITKQEIECVLKLHPAMFSEILYHGRKSNTKQNSIYLDTLGSEDYQNHVSGISQRLKIRIRWYGDLFGVINGKLEVKIKNNELRDKLLFPLKPFILSKYFSSAYLQKEVFAKSNLPYWLIEELKLRRPVLLTSYKRKYFISADKKYRLTLDTEMKYLRIKDRNNLFLDEIKDPYSSILELKYSVKDYKGAEEITQHFPFRLIASSKFIKGIELLDL
ncbi:MAG: hypothetical protein Athens071416_630 [Parcubacteria group bacterium Athens0714_16]|nr:MAG: hypothetical protein Athens071416_630 [Parcubacteria group bacterium Athens0714_16]